MANTDLQKLRTWLDRNYNGEVMIAAEFRYKSVETIKRWFDRGIPPRVRDDLMAFINTNNKGRKK